MLKYSYDPSGNLSTQTVSGTLTPQIIGQPIQQIVEPGQVATFSVVVADANGVTYQWKFNGAAIVGATGDSVIVTNASAAKQGQYTVVVTNSVGSVTSAPATLTIGKDNEVSDPTSGLKLVAYSDPGGTVTVTPTKLNYDLGETITLTATPLAPSVFIGWAGDLSTGDLVSTTNPVSFVMTGNRTVRARFASAFPLPPGLIAFWRGEGDATDLIGGHHGRFFAGSSVVAPTSTQFGKVGGAFAFDGTVYVQVPDSNELKPAQITIEAWVFPTLQSNVFQTIIARGSATSVNDTWFLGLKSGVPDFVTFPAGDLTGLSPIPLNKWTHLAGTFDGTTKRLYVNGILVASQSGLGALIYDPASVPVTIGSDWDNNQSTNRFSGFVDEVALYNRALTIDEVFEIYSADLAGKDVARPYFTTPSPLPDAPPGATYSQQLTTILGKEPISISLSAGALPPGMTLSSTGLLSGASNNSGIFDFTALATDIAGKTAEQLYVLRVLQPVALPADMVSWWRGEPAISSRPPLAPTSKRRAKKHLAIASASDTVQDTLGGHDGGFFSGNTPTSASYTSDGKVGSAFTFDGTVHVRVPDSSELKPAQVTVEAWIYPTLVSADLQTVVARGSATSEDTAWWMGLNSGKPQFWSKHVGSGLHGLLAPSTIPLNAWTHLAISFGDATQGLYVNGVQVEPQAGLGALVYEPPGVPITIGAKIHAGNVSTMRFTGRVDEVSLYQRALSPDEIFSIADAGSAGKRTTGPYINSPSQLPPAVVGQAFSHAFTSVLGVAPVTFALSTSSTMPPGLTLDTTGMLSGVPASARKFAFVVRATDAAGLFAEQRCELQAFESVQIPAGAVGWWRAEGDAQDSVGVNHGVLRNGAKFSPGEVGKAFSLDGSTGFVEIPDAPNLRPVSLTLEAWVAFDSNAGIQVVFAKPVGTGSSDSYAIWLQSGLNGAVGDATAIGAVLHTTFLPVPGRWYHVAYTFDDAAKQQALYVDGAQVTLGTASKSIGYDAQPLLLGRDTENGVPNFFFQGRIDEATVYNRALNAAEIASVYRAGAAGKHLFGRRRKRKAPTPSRRSRK